MRTRGEQGTCGLAEFCTEEGTYRVAETRAPVRHRLRTTRTVRPLGCTHSHG